MALILTPLFFRKNAQKFAKNEKRHFLGAQNLMKVEG